MLFFYFHLFCLIYLIIFAAINQLSINRKQFRSEMKPTIFCGLIATCLLAGSAIPGSAQNKRWEHNLYEGVGMAKKFDSHDNQTVAFHVGYGINYYLSSKWSVMPGVAVRAKALGHNSGYTGNCASTYIDVPLLAQYHFGGEKRQGIVLELGPVVSFLAHSERYYGTEWCPQHPYWGMKEYKNIDVGVVLPSITRRDTGDLACSRISVCSTSRTKMTDYLAVTTQIWTTPIVPST